MQVKSTPVPPRGWNSYDSYGVYINEEQAVANIREFEKRLAPYGYEYFVLDACWYMDGTFEDTYRLRKEGKDRYAHIDEWGRFIESPELFPHGLRYLADMCHNAGFKFGVHLMRGLPARALEENTPVLGAPGIRARDIADLSAPCEWPAPYMGCGVDMTKPGAQEYYDSVVAYLADVVQLDFIKFDDVQAVDDVIGISNAIKKCSRPIVLSISAKQNAVNFGRYRDICNMVRITRDIWDGEYQFWGEKFDRWEQFQGLGSPDCWIDLDMIPIGGIQAHVPEGTPAEMQPVLGCRRKSENTTAEKRTLMAQLALAKSPLFYGGDLPMSDDEDLAYVTNPDMLACHAEGEGGICIGFKYLADIRRSYKAGDHSHGWLGVFNRSHAHEKTITLTAEELGFSDGKFPENMFDIWENKPLIPEGSSIRFVLPLNGCTFIRW